MMDFFVNFGLDTDFRLYCPCSATNLFVLKRRFQMKYLWFILFLLTMACVGMGYILNDLIEYLFHSNRSEAQIVVETPDIQE